MYSEGTAWTKETRGAFRSGGLHSAAGGPNLPFKKEVPLQSITSGDA